MANGTARGRKKRGSVPEESAVPRKSPRTSTKISYEVPDSDHDMDIERDTIGSNLREVKLDIKALAKFLLAGLITYLVTKNASMSEKGDVDDTLTEAFERILLRGLEAQQVIARGAEMSDDETDTDDEEEVAAKRKRLISLIEISPSDRRWWGTPRERLGIIYDLDDADKSELGRISESGIVSKTALDPTDANGVYARGRKILNSIISITAKWICPTNPDTFLALFFNESVVKGGSKLLRSAIDLFVSGHKSVAIVVGSLLARSVTRETLSGLISQKDAVLKSRLLMGEMKFASLRRTHDDLIDGKPAPRRMYPWRVKMTSLTNAISFLEQFLQVIPGDTRTVTLAGNVFKNLPVYDRGGKSLKDIWDHYKAVVPDDQRVGEKTFYEIINLLSTKGKMKDSLSTYYIALRYLDKTFDEMMDRLGSIDILKDVPGVEEFRKDPTKQQSVADDCRELKIRWKSLSTFLSYEYGRDHPSKESNVACHCARHALNADNPSRRGAARGDPGRCSNKAGHEHGDFICKQCADMFLFFDSDASIGPVAKLVDHVRRNMPGANPRNEVHVAQNNVVKELQTMAAVLGNMQKQVKSYAAHCTRWRIQKDSYGEILQSLDDDGTMAVLVLDHKQKVVDVSFREAQVDYFGKRGKSFCGVNLVRRVRKGGKLGFEFVFFDFIIEGYDEQNHIQVCAIISKALEIIKKEFPEIEKIIAKSDNASCMGSTNSIPYIYHLNKEIRAKHSDERHGPVQITRWFNMESQTSKCLLDCHFSYVNVNFRGFVEDGNKMTTHTEIWKALQHGGGIAGSYAILLDTRELATGQRTLLQDGKKYDTKTKSKSIHDIHYFTDKVEVYRYSGITVPEVISSAVLDAYPKCNLPVSIKVKDPADGEGEYFWKSQKEARFVPDPDPNGNAAAGTDTDAAANNPSTQKMSSKAAKLALALEGAGIDFGADADHTPSRGLDLMPSGGENAAMAEALSNLLPPGWAEKDFTRDACYMSADTLQEVHDFEMNGRREKKLKVTFNRMYEVMRPKMNDWVEIFFSSPQKIKAITNWKPATRTKAIARAREAAGTGIVVELTEEDEIAEDEAGQEIAEEAEAEEVDDEAVRAESGHDEEEVSEESNNNDGPVEEMGEDELAAAQLRNERVNRVEVPVERRSGRYGRESVLPVRFREG